MIAPVIPETQLAPGLSISKILTGLWQVADMERDGKTLDPDATAKHMLPYLDAGLHTFDMADHYGSAEIIAGTFRKKYAGTRPVQLLTKWVPEPGPISLEQTREAVQRALNRMQAAQIDLMQFHAWNYADPSWLDALIHLQTLQQEGLIGQLGLTNFDAEHLQMVLESGIRVVSNQICYSLLDQRAAGEMTAVCEKYGVKILAFGTLAGGLLSEKWLGKSEPQEMSTWSQMKYKRFVDVTGGWTAYQQLLSVLHEVATACGVSLANAATRYILDQPAVGGVIIGARLGTSGHIEDNLQTLQFEWAPGTQEALKAAVATLQAVPGGCGDEYRKPPFLTASGDLSHHLAGFPAPYPVVSTSNGRQKALSGTVWEDLAGFSRAIRIGNHIYVSGTTATHGNRVIGGQDAATQTAFILDKIAGALQSLGSSMEAVVRTRIFVKRMEDWEAVSRVHGKRFKGIQPANTLVRADLVGEDYLVEIEAEAIVANE